MEIGEMVRRRRPKVEGRMTAQKAANAGKLSGCPGQS